ncbi:MAG: primosomal protein N' [Lentimicrobiaceae bacterium]|nr:primosomal protein N' [Lentimicrobiaceae bacterium]
MDRCTLFADLLFPLPVKGYFTYRIPYEMNTMVKPGVRVVVQFGKKKLYTALVKSVHEKPPAYTEVKYILSVLDVKPMVNNWQFDFWEWMATYYFCFEGEVMNVALPSAFKLASESRIILNPVFNGDISSLNEKELMIAEAMQQQPVLTLSDAARIAGQLKIIPIIKALIEKNIVLVNEEVEEKYKPHKETYIRIADAYADENSLKQVFEQLEKRAFKQLELLMTYLQLSQAFGKSPVAVSRADLLARQKNADAALTALVKKSIFIMEEKILSRLKTFEAENTPEAIELNEYQQQAYESILQTLGKNGVSLLHGITSSGKTEIYIKLISQVIENGGQVLYLLPEIALTTQIINRLRKYFGNKVGIYHSKFNDSERVEIWNNILVGTEASYSVLLGARSALFLPFSRLRLIIVDEEHDTSFKQMDPAPRYNARDAAIYLGYLHKAPVLLGSATPSVESYCNALSGKYTLTSLTHRFGGLLLPEIFLVNIREETLRKNMKSHFSPFLIESIKETLDANEQVILFQNRRGFSLRIECNACHWVPQCINCDVSLIYHKKINLLKCHYCGYSTHIPAECPDCGHTGLLMQGFGTEKIEEELAIFFPEARIARMDLDTTRSKYSHQQIIGDFENGIIDVLVGTQMVTKGLDFDNVGLVGILNADSMLTYPDFRAYERSFQLMAQVSGRAGRKNKRGKVIIQTYNPQHPIIRYVLNNNFEAMYSHQMEERMQFQYPPFVRLVRLTLKQTDPNLVNKAADALAASLKKITGIRVLGPEYPPVSRIRNQFLKNIIIKIPRSAALSDTKNTIAVKVNAFLREADFKKITVAIDVDPA